jgi:hypothetical protein
MECQHPDVEDRFCLSCGLEVDAGLSTAADEYSKCHQRTKHHKNESFFEKLLYNFGFDIEITTWITTNADVSSITVNKVETRLEIIYAYAYLAYLHLKRYLDPIALAQRMGIEGDGINRALQMASGMSSDVRWNKRIGPLSASIVIIRHGEILQPICDELIAQGCNLTVGHINELKGILLILKTKDTEGIISEECPREVIGGLIKYYFKINSWSFNGISKKMGYKSHTTNKTYKIIKAILSDKDIH